MAKSLNTFRWPLVIGWVILCLAGMLYAWLKNMPGWVAAPALAAFLAAYPFYLVPAFPAARERFAAPQLPAYFVGSTVLPYLICCLGAINFQWAALGQLVALALAIGLWYSVLRASPLSDLGFLALVALVLLGNYFKDIYPRPYPGVEVSFLGRLAVFEMAVLTLMLVRRVPETGYGFWPNRKEWREGALHFVYFVLAGAPLAWLIGAVQLRDKPAPAWAIVGTFFGFLWVVALAEEFFFRGVLQQWMEKWTRSGAWALLITSALFGLVHLPFRRFPNWRWVLLAGTLGWFCGRARNRAGGIRAAVVTHALTVTLWRAFFR